MSRRTPSGNGFIIAGIVIAFVNPVLGAIVMFPGFVIKLSRRTTERDGDRRP
jgi:hypothetical protein